MLIRKENFQFKFSFYYNVNSLKSEFHNHSGRQLMKKLTREQNNTIRWLYFSVEKLN